MAGTASLALLAGDPSRPLFALPLLVFAAWALCALPRPGRGMLLVALPALGGSLGIALVAALGGGEGPRVFLFLGLRALLLAWVWSWTAAALGAGGLASFLRWRLRLATPADLVLVMGRMRVLLSTELERRRRAVAARSYSGRHPSRTRLAVLLAAGLFGGLARRARRAGWGLCARGFVDHLRPARRRASRSILPEALLAALAGGAALAPSFL